jgi:hypothetical protein
VDSGHDAGHRLELDLDGLPVSANHGGDAPRGTGLAKVVPGCVVVGDGLLGQDVRQGHRGHLRAGVARQHADRRVGVHNPAFVVVQDQPVQRMVEQRLQSRLTGPKLGEILVHRHEMAHPTALVADRGDGLHDPVVASVLVPLDDLRPPPAPRPDRLPQPFAVVVELLVRVQQPQRLAHRLVTAVATHRGECVVDPDDDPVPVGDHHRVAHARQGDGLRLDQALPGRRAGACPIR